jgi:hypothetical protein
VSNKFEGMEEAYRQVVFGYDEPDVMWMNGKLLKEMAIKNGKPVENDSDGNPIYDGEVYCLTAKGIYLWQG